MQRTDSASKSNECTRAPSLRAASENNPLPEPTSRKLSPARVSHCSSAAQRFFRLDDLADLEIAGEVEPIVAEAETAILTHSVRHLRKHLHGLHPRPTIANGNFDAGNATARTPAVRHNGFRPRRNAIVPMISPGDQHSDNRARSCDAC